MRKGLLQRELAAILQITKPISRWELGERKIDSHKLGSLVKALSLSADEAQEFILLVNPTIVDGVERGSLKHWLEKTIKQENWQHINFPALDKEWLSAQPSQKQAGLLLGAYRMRKGLLQENLAAILKLKRSTISDFELGKKNILCNSCKEESFRFALIVSALELTDDEKVFFLDIVNLSRRAKESMGKTKTTLGALQTPRLNDHANHLARVKGRRDKAPEPIDAESRPFQ